MNDKAIKFKEQYRFEDCRNIRTLPFDFAIINNDNDSVKLLIEYDGKHHYEPIKHFGGEESLKKRKQLDLIKDEYCKKNNIKLIRIKYTENLQERLDEIFSKNIL